MSHFSVLVIRRPDQSLEDLLQPFHEFECTGKSDQYVQAIDITDKLRAEYEEDTTRRYRDMHGKLHDPYLNEFYRDFTEEELARIRPCGSGTSGGLLYHSKDWGDGKGYRPKVHFLPAGWEEVKLMVRDEQTFLEWVIDDRSYKSVIHGQKPDLEGDHKYGYIELDAAGEVGRVLKRTNPSPKWDWWVVGGRYSGKFAGAGKLAPHEDPRNMEPCFLCRATPGMRNDKLGQEERARNPSYTCNGCNGTGKSLKHAPDWVNEDNEIRAGNLDLAALKARQIGEREKWITEIQKKSGLSRRDLQTALHLDKEAHAKWMALPEPRPRGAEYQKWVDEQGCYALVGELRKAGLWDKPDLQPNQTIEQWIAAAPPLTCFAILKDGIWYERGEMGWWACVSNEKDADDWEAETEKLLRGLDPDMIITCVDCHI